MKKIIRLSESDLEKLISKVISEKTDYSVDSEDNYTTLDSFSELKSITKEKKKEYERLSKLFYEILEEFTRASEDYKVYRKKFFDIQKNFESVNFESFENSDGETMIKMVVRRPQGKTERVIGKETEYPNWQTEKFQERLKGMYFNI